MSTNIKLKRSSVEGKQPNTSILDLGEVAINTFDGKLFFKKDNGTESIVTLLEVTEDNLAIDSSLLDNATANTLSGVLSDLDDAITNSGGAVSGNNAVNNFITIDSYTGNGSNTQFTLTKTPVNEDHVLVAINGVNQEVDTYSVNNNIIILDEVLANNASLEVRTFSSVFAGETLTSNAETLSTTTNNQIVDSFSATSYRTAKYIVQMNDGNDFHSTEVLLLHDGVDTYMTEYATIFTSNTSLGEISSELSGGSVNLLVTPVSANTTIKLTRISIGA